MVVIVAEVETEAGAMFMAVAEVRAVAGAMVRAVAGAMVRAVAEAEAVAMGQKLMVVRKQ